uniref:Regulator of chromosome condensation (RCC1)like protein putative n=1 Tax=Albugo laibachii Nc14 TaxID=890382 RepID=F0WMA9_9STRA|nr:regulator of chromosome condensation (RCC1)like protein putative [Albugo laibachii Nc14]|eukprot:CCA22440.1 regulator of chromosome condensation (RCC1)like protein putative [Albugo laibachii Nc14]
MCLCLLPLVPCMVSVLIRTDNWELDQHTPVRISELTRVIEITAGDFHSLAIAADADLIPQVFSWGYGKNGRLGHNDVNDRLHPTLIDTFCDKKIVSISAGGAHSLARSAGSHVWSWGCGAHGQLGHYNSWDCLKPTAVRELTGEKVEYIDAGERHSLALSAKGELWLWGFGIPPQKCHKQKCDCVHATFYPQKMNTKSFKIKRALAGRGRTFVGTRKVN